EIAFDGRDGGIFNVARSRKMRLPRAKIDQLRALGAQSRSLCGDRHGGRNLDAADPVGENLGSSWCSHSFYLVRLQPIRESGTPSFRHSNSRGIGRVPHIRTSVCGPKMMGAAQPSIDLKTLTYRSRSRNTRSTANKSSSVSTPIVPKGVGA